MSEDKKIDPYFLHLIYSLQMSAMQQMGKQISPISGKIDRDLVAAQASIDMIAMLQTKTKGNLTEEESKLVEHILYELRLNYVDESKKKDDPESKQEDDLKNESDSGDEGDKKE